MAYDQIFDPLRRRVLQGAIAVGAASLYPALSLAQSSLYGLPRHALVIGNSRYPNSPLENPINDAKAIYGKGGIVTDLIGNWIKFNDGRTLTGAQYFIPDYSLGKRWTSRHRSVSAKGTVLQDINLQLMSFSQS